MFSVKDENSERLNDFRYLEFIQHEVRRLAEDEKKTYHEGIEESLSLLTEARFELDPQLRRFVSLCRLGDAACWREMEQDHFAKTPMEFQDTLRKGEALLTSPQEEFQSNIKVVDQSLSSSSKAKTTNPSHMTHTEHLRNLKWLSRCPSIVKEFVHQYYDHDILLFESLSLSKDVLQFFESPRDIEMAWILHCPEQVFEMLEVGKSSSNYNGHPWIKFFQRCSKYVFYYLAGCSEEAQVDQLFANINEAERQHLCDYNILGLISRSYLRTCPVQDLVHGFQFLSPILEYHPVYKKDFYSGESLCFDFQEWPDLASIGQLSNFLTPRDTFFLGEISTHFSQPNVDTGTHESEKEQEISQDEKKHAGPSEKEQNITQDEKKHPGPSQKVVNAVWHAHPSWRIHAKSFIAWLRDHTLDEDTHSGLDKYFYPSDVEFLEHYPHLLQAITEKYGFRLRFSGNGRVDVQKTTKTHLTRLQELLELAKTKGQETLQRCTGWQAYNSTYSWVFALWIVLFVIIVFILIAVVAYAATARQRVIIVPQTSVSSVRQQPYSLSSLV